MLTFGEVQTGFLLSSRPVVQSLSTQILSLVPGERVRRSERPTAYAVSPNVVAGVDCRLATSSGARARGVGTVVSRAAIIGGHVLQGSSHARLVPAASDRRLPWSYYLARTGVVELHGGASSTDLAGVFLAATARESTLDLAAISARTMDRVQSAAGLDRQAPVRMPRTSLRWVAVPVEACSGIAQVRFVIESQTLRTLLLSVDVPEVSAVVEFCEDLALHDWLLTSVLHLIEQSRIGAGPWSYTVDRLRPAIDYLVHLWMPGARVDGSLVSLWGALEQRPGFTKQWSAVVNRIRDQLALSRLALESAVLERLRQSEDHG